MRKLVTLVYFTRGRQVALAVKKTKIGEGKLCGWGGKKKGNETLPECAAREALEEAHVYADVSDLVHVGQILFSNGGKEFDCSVYFLTQWGGAITETDVMGPPEWFDFDNVPFDRTMLGDIHWFPLLTPGFMVHASIAYGNNFASVHVNYARREKNP